MAKRVEVSRKETELTNEEAKQFILDRVFAGVGHYVMARSFLERIRSAGLEAPDWELGKLVNELIDKGKVRIDYDYIGGPMGGPGCILVIRRIA